MEIRFEISDELTVTNQTIRLHLRVSGQSLSDSKDEIDNRIVTICKKFMDVDWTYSNFTFGNNGMTFSSDAYCRIPSKHNDKLENKVSVVNDNYTAITILDIDSNIPSYDIRDAESDLRLKLIELCKKESEKLSGEIISIDFTDQNLSNQKSLHKSLVANAYSDSHSQFGHSQKISMSATVTMKLLK